MRLKQSWIGSELNRLTVRHAGVDVMRLIRVRNSKQLSEKIVLNADECTEKDMKVIKPQSAWGWQAQQSKRGFDEEAASTGDGR